MGLLGCFFRRVLQAGNAVQMQPALGKGPEHGVWLGGGQEDIAVWEEHP